MTLVDAGTGFAFEHIGMPATLHGYQEGGTVAITKLIKSFEAKSGQVRFSTPVTELLTDSNGAVTGVMAKKRGWLSSEGECQGCRHCNRRLRRQ
ncbi:hypothetical protein ACFTAO_12830 [Paenibacillus rhizoplanae]